MVSSNMTKYEFNLTGQKEYEHNAAVDAGKRCTYLPCNDAPHSRFDRKIKGICERCGLIGHHKDDLCKQQSRSEIESET
jgi:hypothetical protein